MEIIEHLEIGDIIVQSGTALIVYDKIRDENGDISDIIFAHSYLGIGNGYIKTKIERNSITTSSGELFSFSGFSLFLNNKANENIGDERLEEGCIGLYKLSENYIWRAIKERWNANSHILVLRFLNEKDGKAILKYNDYYYKL